MKLLFTDTKPAAKVSYVGVSTDYEDYLMDDLIDLHINITSKESHNALAGNGLEVFNSNVMPELSSGDVVLLLTINEGKSIVEKYVVN